MKEELVKLSNKVETHNNFGLQLAKLETRVDILERKSWVLEVINFILAYLISFGRFNADLFFLGTL